MEEPDLQENVGLKSNEKPFRDFEQNGILA